MLTALAVATSALAQLTGPAKAVVLGTNGKIVFESSRDGNEEIYSMNPDGTGQVNLTKNPANDSDPAVSPDGRKIAFASFRDGSTDIYVMNADGTGQHASPTTRRPISCPPGLRAAAG